MQAMTLPPPDISWDTARPPSLAEMGAMASACFAALPEKFRLCCENVVFEVAEFPDRETLDEMGLESEFDLLGLYHGGGVPSPPALRDAVLPDRVFLYRQPLLAYWVEEGERLGDLIRHVLIHEIGHHFGFSDADMEAIEERPDPPPDAAAPPPPDAA